MGRLWRWLPFALAALAACVGAPKLSVPGKSGVWGYVRLVPHEGLAPHQTAGASSSAYGDRRYADVALVDYSKPGFAVVYLEGEARPGAPVTLALRGSGAGLRFEPDAAAVGVGGRVVLENQSGEARVVSCPAAGLLRRLADGESVELAAEQAGELELFAPDGPEARARVFAAPGPFATVNDAGRYALARRRARRAHAPRLALALPAERAARRARPRRRRARRPRARRGPRALREPRRCALARGSPPPPSRRCRAAAGAQGRRERRRRGGGGPRRRRAARRRPLARRGGAPRRARAARPRRRQRELRLLRRAARRPARRAGVRPLGRAPVPRRGPRPRGRARWDDLAPERRRERRVEPRTASAPARTTSARPTSSSRASATAPG